MAFPILKEVTPAEKMRQKLEFDRNFPGLESKLKSHSGELVLIDMTIQRIDTSNAPGPGEVANWDGIGHDNRRHIHAGLIKDPFILIRPWEFVKESNARVIQDDLTMSYGVDMSESAQIVVDPHVSIMPYYPSQNPKNIVRIVEGNIILLPVEQESIYSYLRSIHPRHGEEHVIKSSAYVGDNEVRRFIKTEYEGISKGLYLHLEDLLKTPGKADSILKENNEKYRQQEVISTVRQLEAFKSGIRKLESKINSAYESFRRHESFEFESEVDAYTAEDRRILANMRKDIQLKLEFAVRDGLHKDPQEYLIEESTPGKKTTVKIAEYITGLCGLYKVKA